MSDLQVILPGRPEDQTSEGLRRITAAVEAVTEPVGFGLGGEHGYGAYWDSPVFMMHRYCWCEREDCRWCNTCECSEESTHFYIDDMEVSCDEWWRRNHEFLGPTPFDVASYGTEENRVYSEKWYKRVSERDRRWRAVFPARTHSCSPHGMMADRPEGAKLWPPQTAPNFWHKQSGFRVWWYKWIGRDNEYFGECIWPDVLAECLADVAARSRADPYERPAIRYNYTYRFIDDPEDAKLPHRTPDGAE